MSAGISLAAGFDKAPTNKLQTHKRREAIPYRKIQLTPGAIVMTDDAIDAAEKPKRPRAEKVESRHSWERSEMR